MKGWFKEYHRHSLAAKGVSTNRYFRRMRKLPKGQGSGLLPRTRKTILGTKDPENFLKISFIRSKPKEVQDKFFEKLKESRELDEQIADLSAGMVSLSKLRKMRNDLRKMVDEGDDSVIDQLESIEEELDFAKQDENRELLAHLRTKNAKLKDELAELSGSPLVERSSFKLTNKSLEKSLKSNDIDVDKFKEELLSKNKPQKIELLRAAGINTVANKQLTDLSDKDLDTVVLRVGLANKASAVNPRFIPRGARSDSEVVRKTGLLHDERGKFIKKLEEFQTKQQRANEATAPSTVHTDPKMIERLRAREKVQKDALARARETRSLNKRMRLVKQDIESAKKEEKVLKDRGEFSEE